MTSQLLSDWARLERLLQAARSHYRDVLLFDRARLMVRITYSLRCDGGVS